MTFSRQAFCEWNVHSHRLPHRSPRSGDLPNRPSPEIHALIGLCGCSRVVDWNETSNYWYAIRSVPASALRAPHPPKPMPYTAPSEPGSRRTRSATLPLSPDASLRVREPGLSRFARALHWPLPRHPPTKSSRPRSGCHEASSPGQKRDRKVDHASS